MSFRLEQNKPGGGIPTVRQRAIVPGSTGRKGALLTQTNVGQYAEVTSPNPALNTICSVALSDWGPATGSLFPLGTKEFPPGFLEAWVLDGSTPYLCQYNGALPAAEGGTYGVVKDTNGLWRVDFTNTTSPVVRLADLRTTVLPARLTRAEVGVSFLPGFMQLA